MDDVRAARRVGDDVEALADDAAVDGVGVRQLILVFGPVDVRFVAEGRRELGYVAAQGREGVKES